MQCNLAKFFKLNLIGSHSPTHIHTNTHGISNWKRRQQATGETFDWKKNCSENSPAHVPHLFVERFAFLSISNYDDCLHSAHSFVLNICTAHSNKQIRWAKHENSISLHNVQNGQKEKRKNFRKWTSKRLLYAYFSIFLFFRFTAHLQHLPRFDGEKQQQDEKKTVCTNQRKGNETPAWYMPIASIINHSCWPFHCGKDAFAHVDFSLSLCVCWCVFFFLFIIIFSETLKHWNNSWCWLTREKCRAQFYLWNLKPMWNHWVFQFRFISRERKTKTPTTFASFFFLFATITRCAVYSVRALVMPHLLVHRLLFCYNLFTFLIAF